MLRLWSDFRVLVPVLVAAFVVLTAGAQDARNTAAAVQLMKSDALTDASGLVVSGGKAEAAEYQGRKAVRLTATGEDAFAFVKGAQIHDGTIEFELALKVTTPPGVRMPGFIGIAFRARPDASHYEMFYLRPGNSRSEDQAMRNHSAQYIAAPGYDWYKLRREWPWVYESYADLKPRLGPRSRSKCRGGRPGCM
jgi:hypothetical protein